MPANTLLRWNPEALNRRLLSAFGQSVGDARLFAQRLNPAPSKIGIVAPKTGATSAILKSTGRIGHIFELGRKGGYVIQPGLKTVRGRDPTGKTRAKVTKGVRAGSGNIALKFTKGDGGFARGGVIGGSQRAQPFLRPAGSAWARGLYQRRARAELSAWIGGR